MTKTLLIASLLIVFVTPGPELCARPNPDEPWISHYSGAINAETEMAYLDNVAIQIMNDPGIIGYMVVYSGADSCAGEAQARAIRAKKYLTDARGVPWDRVMWKDGGRFRGKGLEIFHYGVPRSELAKFAVTYETLPQGQALRPCRGNSKVQRDLRG